MAVPVLAVLWGVVGAPGGGEPPPPRGARPSGRGPAAALAPGRPGALAGARITPTLTGGTFGWNVSLYGGGGSCCTVPERGHALSFLTTGVTASGRVTATFLAGPELAAIVLHGHRLRSRKIRLPYGLQVLQVSFQLPHRPASREPAAPPSLPAVRGVDRRGRVLNEALRPYAPGIAERWWKHPSPPAPGPCRLRAQGVPGLTPEWGHTASAILPFGAAITGRAFFSCIDVEYYLHKWPLDAAILLDAQRPGRSPAALPYMTPLAGEPGFFNAPGDFHGPLTAERRGRSWLVVGGGSGAQRLQLLRHLTATVMLPSGHGAPR